MMDTRLGKRLKRTAAYWPAAVFIAVLLFSGFTAYHFTYHILDSDASTELVLGNLLAGENAIVSADWIYGNEIRLFNSNLLYMPLFKLFHNWQTIRLTSILLFQLMMAGSYFYLSRRMKLSLNAYFLSASLLLLPVNVVYGRLGLYHNYYAPCFIYGFLIVGLYLSVLEHRGQSSLRQALRVAAMVVLSLAGSLNGFRQLPGTMLPLFAAVLMIVFLSRWNTRETLAEIPGQSWKNLLLAGAAFAAGVAGLYGYQSVLPRYYHILGQSPSAIALPTMENLRALGVGYLSLFGYQEGRMLLSGGGIIALFGLFAAVVLFIVSLQDLLPRRHPADFLSWFSGSLYGMAMVCMTIIFLVILGNENYPQYYLPAFVWVFPYLGFQIHRMPPSVKQFTVKQAAVALACLCLFCNGLYYNLYYLQPNEKQVTYDIGIDIDSLDQLQGVVDYLNDTDLEVGYAKFWNTAIVSEATNGRVTMIPILFDGQNGVLTYLNYLISLQWTREEFIQGKSVFLLADIQQSEIYSQMELAQYGTLAYEDDLYRIYTFPSAETVWRLIQP